MAKIGLPESWAGVAEPLRALIAELDGDAHAGTATAPDPAAVAERWARVSDAIRAMLRARIVNAQAAER